MNTFIKVNKNIEHLTLNEAYLTYLLSWCKFYNKDITIPYLSKCLQVCDHTITDMLLNIENKGIITRSYTIINNPITGQIMSKKMIFTVNNSSFIKVSTDFIKADLTSEAKGFALRLRLLAYDDSVTIKMSKKAMSEKMNISYKTFLKWTSQLDFLQLNKDMTGYEFTNYFPKTEVIYLKDDYKILIKEILSNPNDSKLYGQTKWFVDNNLYKLKTANKIYDDILAGVLGNSKSTVNSIEKITFDF